MAFAPVPIRVHFCSIIAPVYGILCSPTASNLDITVHMQNGKDIEAALFSFKVPFFDADKLYGMKAQFTVALPCNVYDRITTSFYRNCMVLYWVQWETLENEAQRVAPMSGVWYSNIEHLYKVVSSKRNIAKHDFGSMSAYLFDVRNFRQVGFAPYC